MHKNSRFYQIKALTTSSNLKIYWSHGSCTSHIFLPIEYAVLAHGVMASSDVASMRSGTNIFIQVLIASQELVDMQKVKLFCGRQGALYPHYI